MENSVRFVDSRNRSQHQPISFSNAKNNLIFNFNLKKVSNSVAVIQVQMVNPFPKRGELFNVVYIPVRNLGKQGVRYLSEQYIGYVFKFKTEYMLVKSLDKCKYTMDVFYCDEHNVEIVSSFSYDCLVGILKNNRADCNYFEIQSGFKNIVHFGKGNFYYIHQTEIRFSYECPNSIHKGVLVGSGIFTIDENCKFTTNIYSISNNGGEIEQRFFDNKFDEYKVSFLGSLLFISSTSVIILSMLTLCIMSIIKIFRKPRYTMLRI
uniref:Uncharacterized protein n=1 Tax=Megaselia scalaris TaxID=36166 RepID=T1GLK6_MEGSC